MSPKYDFGVDEVPDHKEIIYMKEILIVADYVPSFGGSYIQSMKALEKAERIHVRYLFLMVAEQ